MACGSCGARAQRTQFVHISTTGKETNYNSEYEARAAAARKGGKYVKR